MTEAKQFKTHAEQVELLRMRGMRVDDQDRAEHLLARLNYYRLVAHHSTWLLPSTSLMSGCGTSCSSNWIGLRWPFAPCSATNWDVSTRWFTWTRHA